MILVLGTLGVVAIAWVLAIEIAVLLVSLVIGIFVGLNSGWATGLFAGVISYFVINKILWFCDIFEMILSGRPNKSQDAEQNAAGQPATRSESK